MKCTATFSLAALFILIVPALNLTTDFTYWFGVPAAEAGPFAKQRKARHSQPPAQEIDTEEVQKCKEMLQSGDSEGAQACMEQLQGDDSRDEHTPSKEAQEITESKADAVKGTVQENVPIGTIAKSLPEDCEKVVVNNISYSRCGADYYRAAFQGSSLVFVTVDKP